MTNQPSLLPLLKPYLERDPATAAKLLKTLDEKEAVAILKVIPPQLCAKIFPHLDVAYGTALIEEAPSNVLESLVKQMKPEQVAPILLSLSQEKRKTLLDHLPDAIKRQISDLLSYPENSAGRIMSTQFIAFNKEVRVKDAIHRIRSTASRYGPATYTYVIDDENHLVGVLNMRDLMLASSDASLEEVMDRRVFAVDGFMDREELASQLATRHFSSVPVIDAERHLIGTVKTDQLIGHVQEEATEDILKMVGAGGDERAFSSVPFSLRKRLPWLNVNLATAFLAAGVVSLFEDIISKITILAVFLPVVAGQGGNAGAQSLAVVMRGLVMREIRPQQFWRLVLKEATVGALNGLIIGLVTAGVAWLWNGNAFLGVVIGLAMIVNLTAAGLSGAAIPLAMKAIGWDPAQSSSIILTTVTDVVGFFAFLGFAVLFKNYLM